MIKVAVTGLKDLEARFANITARIRLEMKAANEEVGKHLEEAAKKTIDMGGPGFPPLSPMTVSFKGHDTILIDSARFRDGIKHKSWTYHGEVFPTGSGYASNDGRHIVRGKHATTYASTSGVALVHERETTIANGFGRGITIKIPARPVFLFTARRERVKVAAIYLKGLRRALGI